MKQNVLTRNLACTKTFTVLVHLNYESGEKTLSSNIVEHIIVGIGSFGILLSVLTSLLVIQKRGITNNFLVWNFVSFEGKPELKCSN